MRAKFIFLIKAGFFLILIMFGISLPAQADGDRGAVESLGDGAYLFRHGQQRSLFVVGDNGVVVTDPVNDRVASDYLAAIRELTEQPVRYVVYSHYHWDRASGARVFKDAGATIISQQRCADRFEINPNPAVVPPDVTFDQSMSINVGRRSLDLLYFGPSHGDCLTALVARPANILQVVDLLNPDVAAFPREGMVSSIKPHNLRQFWSALSQFAEDTKVARIAAYHAADASPATPIEGEVGLIKAQSDFWMLVYKTIETVRAERRVGIDGLARLRTEELAAFEGYPGFDPDELGLTLRRFNGYYDMGR